MKTFANQDEAEAAVASVLEVARRAAEAHGVELVASAAGFIDDKRSRCAISCTHVGEVRRSLELAATGLGAIHGRCAVDFGHVGIDKAMMWGFEHAEELLDVPPLRVVPPAGDA